MIALLLTPAAAIDFAQWLNYPLIRLGEDTVTVLTVAKILFWIVAIFGLNFLLGHLLLVRVLRRTRFAPGLQFAITRMFGYIFVALGIYVALVVNGVNLSSLAVVAGALGLGIGFGLQSIVANFVAGLVLLAERPVAVGDRIEVAGVAGSVRKISMRATTVVTNDNISIIVPNSELTSSPVTNWSHGGPRVRIRLPVGVAYGTDPEKVRAALLAAAAGHEHVLKLPEPSVYFDGFGDNALNFELAVWTDTMTHSPRRFRSDLNYAIERVLREREIEIPFPQRVVHLRPPPEAANGDRGPDAERSRRAAAGGLG
ncbi:MAG TPA: mechanosensitive ion channel domain-containing protein [Opitutus sp.]|nr:mechanosensitive ion channel domain-containing protein [Opitutus sp.]